MRSASRRSLVPRDCCFPVSPSWLQKTEPRRNMRCLSLITLSYELKETEEPSVTVLAECSHWLPRCSLVSAFLLTLLLTVASKSLLKCSATSADLEARVGIEPTPMSPVEFAQGLNPANVVDIARFRFV